MPVRAEIDGSSLSSNTFFLKELVSHFRDFSEKLFFTKKDDFVYTSVSFVRRAREMLKGKADDG